MSSDEMTRFSITLIYSVFYFCLYFCFLLHHNSIHLFLSTLSRVILLPSHVLAMQRLVVAAFVSLVFFQDRVKAQPLLRSQWQILSRIRLSCGVLFSSFQPVDICYVVARQGEQTLNASCRRPYVCPCLQIDEARQVSKTGL